MNIIKFLYNLYYKKKIHKEIQRRLTLQKLALKAKNIKEARRQNISLFELSMIKIDQMIKEWENFKKKEVD